MHHELNPMHLLKARTAILDVFRKKNIAPESVVNIHAFMNERTVYTNGYFNEALLKLEKDTCIEILMGGRFLRLTDLGYEEANTM
ncbi:hypothetical protein Undi14_01510 [Undibacterium sp. 14-3-2]|uniref:hypothetical protein n=1 Tax=Undibacterium sp. 14-3-2 TaxID=2800129 RepID=UPI001905CFC9|nr:hypothetical protein [Undibacterium sp. 14-3-2]MBK1888694.1 hypothetical protein [Undibacterium sp. 14-3-2]